MQNPEIGQMADDPNKITQTVQNGVLIIKKRQNDPDEMLFYNTDYFKRIGFPEIEVSLVPVTVEKGDMKGGYYKHPEKLTFPFRHFVFLVQREGYRKQDLDQEQEQEQDKEEYGYRENTPEPAKRSEYKLENPAYSLFEKIGKYGNKVSNNLRSGMFAKNAAKPEETIETPEEPETIDTKEQKQEKETQYFWVLRIPIIESEEIIPLGKYEKMEMRLEQIIKDEKVDKSLGKSKEVEEIMVNGRVLRLCKRVKEWSPINKDNKEEKNKSTYLLGSKMSKLGYSDIHIK
jgi:hypothetical protein